MTIARTPLFFGPEQRSLFGWYHAPADERRELAVVICPPFGREYVDSYRSLGELADRLAEQGIAALRFDYDGTGDSAGGDTEAARVPAWRESIVIAMRMLSGLSGCERIALAGFRLGATLAVSVAIEVDVAALVLREPCMRGQTFVDELNASDDGFLVTADTQLELGCLDVAAHPPKTTRVLIDPGDEGAPGTRPSGTLSRRERDLVEWIEAGIRIEHSDDCEIVNWLTGVAGPPIATTTETSDVRSQQTIGDLRETLVRFGADDALFGIISEPLRPARAAAATVILSNAAPAHHVGPNRLYVSLARALSRAGFRVLRFDSPDDSVSAIAGAIRMLDQQRSPSSFVLAGLGSGAQASLRAALELGEDPIVECILINLPMGELDATPRRRRWWPRFSGGQPRNDLERHLTRIAESGRKIVLLFSPTDPRFELPPSMKHFRRRGLIDVWRSDASTMIESLVRHLAERYLA